MSDGELALRWYVSCQFQCGSSRAVDAATQEEAILSIRRSGWTRCVEML